MRWSLPAPARISAARWAPGDGYLVAYHAGDSLRVVGGDGAGERRLAAARPGVAAAWRPGATHTLAYADARGRVAVLDADTGARAWRSAPIAGIRELIWSPRGDRLLALSARRVVLYGDGGARLASRELPRGTSAGHVAWAPRGTRIALVRSDARATRSEVVLLDAARGLRERALFARLGRFGAPAWSPDGSWLLVPWPDADQWLFLRPDATTARRTAVANIARQFAPGAAAGAYPRSVQWCCP